MFITRRNSIRIVAPLALAGALMFTGCAAAPAEDSGAAASVETETDINAAIVTEDTLMSGNAEFDAQLAELGTELRAAAAEGVSLIRLSVYGPESVGIQVWTDDEDGILTGAQLKPVLDLIASFRPLEPIGLFEIDGWDAAGMQGEANGAAKELGVRAEFIDNDWWSVKIPGDQVASIFE